jgi:deoxyribodipyrimidine photolyase
MSICPEVSPFVNPFLMLEDHFSLLYAALRFYWEIHDLFNKINRGKLPTMAHITGQLIWREYFYTMAVQNPQYDKAQNNPICLNIPWDEDETLLLQWKEGRTGYPFVDAAQRQLLQEGSLLPNSAIFMLFDCFLIDHKRLDGSHSSQRCRHVPDARRIGDQLGTWG